MSNSGDLQRLTALFREIQARELELRGQVDQFEELVKTLARKLAVSEERVCEMIGQSHG